jgi:hypothetical protein
MSRKSFRLSMLFFLSFLLFQSPNTFAYQLDKTNRVISVSPSATPAATTSDLRSAFSYLVNRADKTNLWTMKFAPGNYTLSAQVASSGLQNTIITSSDLSKPAKLIKVAGWNSSTSAEYLLYFRMCKQVQMIGMEFYGQTNFATNANPYWPDQGVYFGSCNVVKVDRNKFFNFGNAALRVVTDSRDPVPGVNSFKTMVSNNTFNNIYQTATTSTDNIHGGTALSTWVNNTFVNLRGSIKFASRTAGARTIEFINNVVNGGNHFGLEINNYTDFTLRGNTIQNIKEVAINIYTANVPNLFAWGDNFTIANNNIRNVGRGIRYSHDPYSSGYQNVPKNLIIDGNTLSEVRDPLNYVPAIWVTGGVVDGVKVTNNKLYSIANKKYIGVIQGSKNVSILNNMVDGVAYGTQSTTASR